MDSKEAEQLRDATIDNYNYPLLNAHHATVCLLAEILVQLVKLNEGRADK